MAKTSNAPAIDAPAPDIASELLASAPSRTPYTLPDGGVPFAAGIIARGVHTSQTDHNGNPLPVLVYEPRGARAQLIPLNVVAHAIASGLITANEIAALQARGV